MHTVGDKNRLLIIGSGGNGQTYFMNFLKKNNVGINKINDEDGLKHRNKYGGWRSDLGYLFDEKVFTKCIFLYNHPYYSIQSHMRKGEKSMLIQSKKLGNPYSLESKHYNKQIFKQLTINCNRDIFGIENQFNNWVEERIPIPILFLDFTQIVTQKNILNNFLETELNYDLFEYKERKSTSNIDNDLFIIYDQLFKEMQRKIIIKQGHV